MSLLPAGGFSQRTTYHFELEDSVSISNSDAVEIIERLRQASMNDRLSLDAAVSVVLYQCEYPDRVLNDSETPRRAE